MKTTLLILFSAAIGLTASAQGPGSSKMISSHQSPEARRAVNAVLQKQIATVPAAKTTDIKKRLVAFSYLNNGILRDSNHYYYSGYRGSDHSNIYSFFDYYMPQASIITEGGQFITAQAIRSDSSLTWDLNNSGDMELTLKKAYTYDAQDRVVSCLDSNTGWWYTRADLEYDAQGRLSSFLSYDTFGGTQLIAKSKTYVLYDAAGRRVEDSSVSLPGNQPAYRSDYTYDANGNLTMFTNMVMDAGVWDPQGQNLYTYDNNNRLVRFISQYFYQGDLYNNWKDSFTYSGSNTQFSLHQSFYYDNQVDNWHPDFQEYDVINAQGLVDSYYLFSWNVSVFDTTERDYIVYDNNNLALYGHGHHYLGNGNYESTPYDKQTWYYEEYNVPTAVNNLTGESGRLEIYPNPAQNELHLRGTFSVPAVISVLGLDGRILYDRPVGAGEIIIDLHDFSAGTYFILLKDKQGIPLQKGKFIRL